MRLNVRLHEDIAATLDARRDFRVATLKRHALAAEHQATRAIAPLQSRYPRNDRLLRITGPPDIQIRNQAQAGKMLDGLVCRPILPQSYGVMCKDKHAADLHQRGHSQS